jgi:predicted ferric reductase
LRYRSGQFAFLRFDHPDLRGEEHPFSFTSAVHEDEVAFAVRPRGDFTAKLSRLKAGDQVRVNGGFGAFHPRRGTAPLALIGSGIGSAPLISILKDLAVREPGREVVCVLSVRSRNELVDGPALEALKAAMPQLTLRVLVPREDGQYYGPEVLARELGDVTRFQCYVCASDEVRAVVVRALKGLGVQPRRIHFEAFNLG